MSDNTEMYPKLSEKCYWECTPSDDGYYYYLQVADLDYSITPHGVSVCREDLTTTLLPFEPIKAFGERPLLSDDQLCFILTLPVNKGEHHTKEQMEAFYQQYLAEHKF
jgi:hypothetical protein